MQGIYTRREGTGRFRVMGTTPVPRSDDERRIASIIKKMRISREKDKRNGEINSRRESSWDSCYRLQPTS